MAQGQTVDDIEDEAFLRQLVQSEEDRRRLHPTSAWVGGYRWFRSARRRFLLVVECPDRHLATDRRLTDGTGHGIRSWSSSDPPLSPSPPLSPLQIAIDEIASRVAQLSLFGRDPSKFASARSEIVAELRRLARG